LLVQKKHKKNDKTFLKFHHCVNQKKRKISFKSRKYVNYIIYSIYPVKNILKKSKNPTTALDDKKE